MRRITITQFIVVLCAVISTVLLSFVSTVSPVENVAPVEVAGEIEHGHTLEEQVANARKNMKSDVIAQVNAVESAISTNRDAASRGQLYDSIVRFLVVKNERVYAAWLAEQKATKDNGSDADWQQAGDRYRVAAGFQEDAHNHGALFEAAMRCYSKALELDPKNLEAKVGLGSCIVQSTNDPMKGIGLLLEVVATDSTNVNAQLELGQFSVKRNAPDKAIERYSTALRLRPDYYGLHLSLADLYKQMGDTAKAIYHLEQYVQIETDPFAKNDVENAISRLRAQVPEPK